MNLAIDVQYDGDSATVAGILFQDWSSSDVARTLTVEVGNIMAYEPGAFYKRELPCILELLKDVPEDLEVIIIDGFVKLGGDETDGLGMHLYRALKESIPVIGVAKKPFTGTPKGYEIFRGDSSKPLLVSSVGISLSESKELIQMMHGKHRIPTLLKRADQVCRGINI
jgi:deoxyribonuclease V